jgi:hypothetical protein
MRISNLLVELSSCLTLGQQKKLINTKQGFQSNVHLQITICWNIYEMLRSCYTKSEATRPTPNTRNQSHLHPRTEIKHTSLKDRALSCNLLQCMPSQYLQQNVNLKLQIYLTQASGNLSMVKLQGKVLPGTKGKARCYLKFSHLK